MVTSWKRTGVPALGVVQWSKKMGSPASASGIFVDSNIEY